MKPRVKASAINIETLMNAILVEHGNEPTATGVVKQTVKSPNNYDMGARLYAMFNTGWLERHKTDNGNAWAVSKKGKERLNNNRSKVQVYGSYDLGIVGEPDGAEAIMGNSYSKVADDAMSELADIIQKNSHLKTTIRNVLNQLDAVLGA